MRLNKQETFDICMTIVLVSLVLSALGWIVVKNTDSPCKNTSPYANTLQHDIHRKTVCKGDK